jgi:hypothetical protein
MPDMLNTICSDAELNFCNNVRNAKITCKARIKDPLGGQSRSPPSSSHQFYEVKLLGQDVEVERELHVCCRDTPGLNSTRGLPLV